MFEEQEVQKYMDLLAKAIMAFDFASLEYPFVYAIKNAELYQESVYTTLQQQFKESTNFADFLIFLEKYITEIASIKSVEKKAVYAEAICRWMDLKISYFKEGRDNICLDPLLHFNGNEIAEISALNSNYVECGIQIIPKFPVTKLHYLRKETNETSGQVIEKEKDRSTANRDAFRGINNVLNNIGIVNYADGINIHNIIIPANYAAISEGTIKVAFCPMGDLVELQTEYQAIRKDNVEYNGVSVKVKNPQLMADRFMRDLLTASEKADIVFFPEILGHPEYINLIERNGTQYLESIRKAGSGNPSMHWPMLMILPSIWKDGENYAYLIDKNGIVLGAQRKYYPFVNKKERYIEALKQFSEKDYYIIHIPYLNRIAVIICSEFLSICEGSSALSPLFEEIGVSLVIVPSYTHGELDFTNALPSLKRFGTTVVWGNSCHAVHDREISNRFIGGCSIAGTPSIGYFSNYCRCKGECSDNQTCVFYVSLPLQIDNKMSHDYSGTITHHLG